MNLNKGADEEVKPLGPVVVGLSGLLVGILLICVVNVLTPDSEVAPAVATPDRVVEHVVEPLYDLGRLGNGDAVLFNDREFCISSVQTWNLQSYKRLRELDRDVEAPIEIHLRLPGECI
jgi:hypothetical protein